MFAAELIVLLLVGAALAPDSALGRWLIKGPARALAEMTPRKALLSILAFVLLTACVLGTPELVPLVGFADLSVMMDLAALALLVTAGARLAAARDVGVRVVRTVAARTRLRARRLRTPRLRRPKPPSPDDEPAWAYA